MIEQYGATGILAGIAQVAYLATAFGLGGLLLVRSRRSGDLHQRLLGLHLVLAMGVGYLLLAIATAGAEFDLALGMGVRFFLGAVGNLGTIAGLVAILVFTRGVFRAGDPIATAAFWILSGLMLGGYALYGATGGFPSAGYESAGGALMMLGILASNVWVAYEPLRYHRLMRRRLEVGLAEPLVVDRFLLWGVGSASRTLLVVVGVGASVWVHRIDPALALPFSKAVLVGTSVCGVVTSVAFWLAFFPSSGYRRWVAQRYRTAEA